MSSSATPPPKMPSAIFLDRDGVINEDRGYAYRLEDLQILPDVGAALQRLQSKGYELIIVSNQSGVARGYFTWEEALEFNRALLHNLASQFRVNCRDALLCPFHPQGSIAEYAKDSDWRKPQPGMILEAARRHRLDLAASYMIGDKYSDIECAVRAGVQGIQVLSNQIPKAGADYQEHPRALAYVRGLNEAEQLIP